MIYTREALKYRDSCNPKVAQAEIEVRMGQKWRAAEALDVIESQLRHRVPLDTVAMGADLGSSRTPYQNTKERQKSLIQEELQAAITEKLANQMIGMRHREAWTRQELASESMVSWAKIWKPTE